MDALSERALSFLADDPALQAKACELHRRVEAYLGRGEVTADCLEPLHLTDDERDRILRATATAARSHFIATQLIEGAKHAR